MVGVCGNFNSMGGWVKKKSAFFPLKVFFSGIALIQDFLRLFHVFLIQNEVFSGENEKESIICVRMR